MSELAPFLLSYVFVVAISACGEPGSRGGSIDSSVEDASRALAAESRIERTRDAGAARSAATASSGRNDAGAQESARDADAAVGGEKDAGAQSSASTLVQPTLTHTTLTDLTSFAMTADLAGRPIVATREGDGLGRVFRLDDGDGAFTQLGAPVTERKVLSTPAVAVHTNGDIYFAWLQANDENSANEIRVRRFAGERWNDVLDAIAVRNSNTGSRPAEIPRLALDAVGRPIVAFLASNNPLGQHSSFSYAEVRQGSESAWIDVSPSPAATMPLRDVAIAIDPAGKVSLAVALRNRSTRLLQRVQDMWTFEDVGPEGDCESALQLVWLDRSPVLTCSNAGIRLRLKAPDGWRALPLTEANISSAATVIGAGTSLLAAVGVAGIGSVYQSDGSTWTKRADAVGDAKGWSGPEARPFGLSYREGSSYLGAYSVTTKRVQLTRLDRFLDL